MRIDGFLRTPIRGDHQIRMQNLTVSEVALSGNPTTAAPYPQSLEITFSATVGVSEVQIAPLWEGLLRFIADDVTHNPTDPDQVSETQYLNWSVTGDLILRTWYGLEEAFKKHIAFVTPAPATVRYSKVQLTRDFLFTTFRHLSRLSFVYDGKRVHLNDSQWFEKFVVQFLQGKASMPCLHHADDAAQDFALNAMPSVKLEAPGTLNRLLVTVASLSADVLDVGWFQENPIYDGIAGDPLVDPALIGLQHQLYSSAHPSHSVIPALVLFQEAAAAAYAADHSATSPLRLALSTPRTDGRTYRRIDLIRPPIPGAPISSYPQRPYPTYQLCWRPVAGGVTESIRIPLSGRLYLPLASTDHTFWAIRRTGDPGVSVVGDSLQLSVKSAAVKYIGVPQPSLNVAVNTNRTLTIFAHLHEFDSQYIFESFNQIRPHRAKFKNKAKADWNVEVLDWLIASAKEDFAPIYGYIRESAGRHGLAPEFLHAIFMGEGGNLAINGQAAFDPVELLDAFGFVGLDLILYRLGKVPVGKPPYPPEIPAANVEEINEYHYDLQANGYVDASFSANVAYSREVVRHEAGFTRTLQVGQISGWQTAIELVAAELHQRLDEMADYCANKVPPIPLDDELRRRYLAYVRFNSRLATARQHADDISNQLRRWTGTPPPDNTNARYNALQRIAVAQWYENSQVYR